MPVLQLPSPAALAEFGQNGLFGGVGWLAYDLTDSEYRDAFKQFSNTSGYRLIDLCGYCQGDDTSSTMLYGAIWEECRDHPAQYSDHAIAFDDFQPTFNDQKAAGFGPVRICGYTSNGVTMFAAIWEHNGKADWAADHNIDLADLDSHVQQVAQMNYRITDLNVYMLLQANPDDPSGQQIWAPKVSLISVPNDGRAWMVNPPVPFGSYQNYFYQQQSLGWAPVQLSGYGGEVYVIGRWEKPPTSSAFGQSCLDAAAYQAFLNSTDKAAMRPKTVGAFNQMVTLEPPPFLQYSPNYVAVSEMRIDRQIIPGLAAEFLRNYNIPGLSLAVARQGKLVYAAGFGTANKATGEVVQTTSQFRIASLSKAITATMIFLLIDRRQLFLDDLVFGPNGKLGSFGQPVDERVTQITVHQLLQHAGGGWANDNNDPMYTHPELYYPSDLVKKVIATRSLDNAPGTAYAYSNFGYCVLGRVIEAAIGATYPYDVSENFMGQLPGYGLGMTIATNVLSEKLPNEVVYYGTGTDDPYGMLVSRMDSHGGWVGTATDYLRFMVRADGLPTVPDLLSANSMTTMTTPSGLPNSNGYACGVAVGTDGTWSHTGSLAGSRSIMVRTADGYCWVALVNSGTTDSDDPTIDTLAGLDSLMWAIRDKVDNWSTDGAL